MCSPASGRASHGHKGLPCHARAQPASAQGKSSVTAPAAGPASCAGLGCRVHVLQEYHGERCDLLIALHALHSYPSVERYRSAHPDAPLVVALTGTDLYGSIHTEAEARRALWTWRLVWSSSNRWEWRSCRKAPGARHGSSISPCPLLACGRCRARLSSRYVCWGTCDRSRTPSARRWRSGCCRQRRACASCILVRR